AALVDREETKMRTVVGPVGCVAMLRANSFHGDSARAGGNSGALAPQQRRGNPLGRRAVGAGQRPLTPIEIANLPALDLGAFEIPSRPLALVAAGLCLS